MQDSRRLNDRGRQALPTDADVPRARPPRSLGIVGAGLMGRAIAADAARHGLSIVMTDCDAAALSRAKRAIAAEGDDARQMVERLVRTTTDLAAVARCDVVLESVAESVDVKRTVYAGLEPSLAEQTILGTNTSTIPIGRLAEGFANPRRFCGIHFFHPVRERPLVEVVRGPTTDAHTLTAARSLADALGKTAIVVEDGPGFLVNRLLLPYLTEAMELLLDGVPIERVEAAATTFGMAKGPLRLLDEIGLDTALAGGRVLWEAFGDRVVVSPLMIAMYKAGRFGQKSGAGFFTYSDASDVENPPVDAFAVARISDWSRAARTFDDDAILARLLLPMVLEATRLVEEGKVADPRDVDLGTVFGLGFPAARGGLLHWADSLGAAEIVAMLRPLENLGPRAHPTPVLLDMAAKGAKWYP